MLNMDCEFEFITSENIYDRKKSLGMIFRL